MLMKMGCHVPKHGNMKRNLRYLVFDADTCETYA